MNNDLDILKNQHVLNYKNVILEYIKSNSISLFDEDIMSLFNKPPLDSMDIINVKLLSLAKKNKIILNNEEINKILDSYREYIKKNIDSFKNERINYFNSIVDKSNLDKDNETIKILKKDVNGFDKKLKKNLKLLLDKSIDKNILSSFNKIFFEEVDNFVVDRMFDDFKKYILGSYIKQLMDSIDIKVLVKDTLLINNCKEETERYLYTVENSHLFN